MAVLGTLVSSIPSPSSGEIELGPVQVHAYGLMLLLGIIAATWLTGRRYTGRWAFWSDPRGDLVFRVAMWGVLGGIVGARIYHVVTSWSTVDEEWWEPFAVWEGGLGIWGGIAGGVLVGAWVVKRSGESVLAFMDVVAPGLLLAQAIGRWGNYFNQELFGEPTDLPWGLEIDLANRPADFALFPTFTRRSSTSRSGASWAWACSCSSTSASTSAPRDSSASTSSGTASVASGWSCCGSTRRTSSRAAPERLGLDRRLRARADAFVWSQRRAEGGKPKKRSEPPPPPEGPTMAIPKGRVR